MLHLERHLTTLITIAHINCKKKKRIVIVYQIHNPLNEMCILFETGLIAELSI